MSERYCVETILRSTVSQVLRDNGAKEDESVWDYVDQSDVTTYHYVNCPSEAEALARKNVKLDEFQEIRIIHQVLCADEDGYENWEDESVAYLYPETKHLNWEPT